tara:strand:- start:1221 stop:1835 length:615 start_codon:yes stop_codon:yes gene_type:complete
MSKKLVGDRSPSPKGTWVQTERAAHEAWAKLSIQSPKAGALLHLLAAKVGDANAVVIGQKPLAAALGCSTDTIKRALKELVHGQWIEIRTIQGASNAYVLNDRVVWARGRDDLRYSEFTARVIVSEEDQADRDELGQQPDLRRLPRMGEWQLPSGSGEAPPSSPSLPGMEVDLPATGRGRDDGEAEPIGNVMRRIASQHDGTDA